MARPATPAVLSLAILAALAVPLPAQMIQIKTVPIAQADQFAVFPSRNAGIGGLAIALADTVLDASINPAKAARLGGGRFFGSPVIYSVSEGSGAGRTLPVGAFGRAGGWFGGLAGALQEVDAGQGTQVVPQVFGPQGVPIFVGSSLNERSHGNSMGFAMLGRSFPAGISVGASAFGARLTAVDGVDFLYAGSAGIIQSGHAADFRLGLLKEWGAGSLEALVLYDQYAMTHDVTFLDTFWDPATQAIRQASRMEHNLDHTNTWGFHAGYQRPLGTEGWRVGAITTVNLMSHPKIPNFDVRSSGIVAIPWDPGNSWAYNIGLGASRVVGPTIVGLDAIYEPIWTYTWGEATSPTGTVAGGTIPLGAKTVENHFRFRNYLVRLGASREMDLGSHGTALIFQLGLSVHAISYRMDQLDNVLVSWRAQREHWSEKTPTWGLVFRFPELEIRYQGRVTTGVGRPGVIPNNGCGRGCVLESLAVPTGSVLIAPSGPLTLGDVKVATHQISISVPLGLNPGRPGGAR